MSNFNYREEVKSGKDTENQFSDRFLNLMIIPHPIAYGRRFLPMTARL